MTETEKSLKIIELTTENVKKVTAVNITPENNMVVIGGNNGEGKSSILDSIMMALAGGKHICPKPLKEGAKKGKTVVNIGKYIITRTFTEKGGGTLTVKSQDGASYSSPQKILDELTGDLSFDPVKFSTEEKGQLETLKNLVGLDFTDLDNERKTIFDKRTGVGKSGKETKIKLESTIHTEGTKEIDIAETITEIQNIEKKNLENKNARDGFDLEKKDFNKWCEDSEKTISDNQSVIDAYEGTIVEHEKELERLEEEIKTRKKTKSEKEVAQKTCVELFNSDKEKTEGKIKDRFVEIEKIEDKKTDDLQEILKTAAENNKKHTVNLERAELEKEKEKYTKQWDDLSAKIKDIDSKKAKQLSEAKFPVKGLSFDESGVLFNDVPFSQASGAESLRVSVAMGIALNPKLKVILIRDASLLDENNMKILYEMAEEHDCQLWVERVGKSEDCSVIIEDGVLI